MSPDQIEYILDYVKSNPSCTAQEIGTTSTLMKALEARGLVKNSGKRSTGFKGKPPLTWVSADVEIDAPSALPILAKAIEETRIRYPQCKCETLGLHESLDLLGLRKLQCGCMDPWYACPRLDAVRRQVLSKVRDIADLMETEIGPT